MLFRKKARRRQAALGRRMLIWLCVGAILVLIPHLLHLPLWASVIVIAVAATRLIYSGRGDIPGGKIAVGLIAIAATAGVFLQYHTLAGRDAGVTLLILMFSLKLLESREKSDAVKLLLLSYFIIISNFFFDQSIPGALHTLIACAVITGTMIHLHQGPGELPWIDKLKTASTMMAQSMPIAIILFVLFPRVSEPLWFTPDSGPEARLGLSNEMSPGSVSRLTESSDVALRASFNGAPPSPQNRYWRGPVFSSFDGYTWRSSSKPGLAAQLHKLRPQTTVEQLVTLEPSNQRWLIALDAPIRLGTGVVPNQEFVFTAKSPIHQRRTYRAFSGTGGTLPTMLSGGERSANLNLPRDKSPKARELAGQWRQTEKNDAAIVRAALHYFSAHEFFYTLSPPVLRLDPVDEFLFGTRRGFCEHYASSFAVLMRAAGIPARIVTGYLGGEWNDSGKYLSVLQADAHAWVEVWLSGQGWLRIDPTSAVTPSRVEGGLAASIASNERLPFRLRQRYGTSFLNSVNQAWDNLNYQWIKWVLAYGDETQRELFERLGLKSLGVLTVAAIMALIIGALSLLYMLWHLFQSRALPESGAARAYRRLCKKIGRATGRFKYAWEGPRDYGERTAPQLDTGSRDEVLEAMRLYCDLRYGKIACPALEKQFRQKVAAIRIARKSDYNQETSLPE